MSAEYTKNAVERSIPRVVNGTEQIPFEGVGKNRPTGHKAAPTISTCADYRADGNKLVGSLHEAIEMV